MSAPPRGITRARTRRAIAAVESPADALLAVRMLGWALVLPVLKSALPLQRLVRLMAREGRATARDTDTEHTIITLSRVVHRAVGLGRRDNCLERSLIAFRYLSAANADPLLVVGACAGATEIEGHVWLTVDGDPVHETRERVDRYARVTEFHADGRVGAVPRTSP